MASAPILSRFQHFRGVFAGAGSGFFIEPIIVDAVLELAQQISQSPQLLYIGTCSYDSATARIRQIQGFTDRGVNIKTLDIANKSPSEGYVDEMIDAADIIVVSGGNTLFGIDRMRLFNVDIALSRAAQRGAVLCGGSAGAICWFDGGHSDSMDPASYRKTFLLANAENDKKLNASASCTEFEPGGANEDGKSEELVKEWNYIRSPCLGFLPGLMCPNHDQVQSNGILRATDFEAMLKRHPGEQGICIDHFAALVVENGNYRVDGKPSVMLKRVVPNEGGDGEESVSIEVTVLTNGKLEDILKEAQVIEQDPRLDLCRKENPSNF